MRTGGVVATAPTLDDDLYLFLGISLLLGFKRYISGRITSVRVDQYATLRPTWSVGFGPAHHKVGTLTSSFPQDSVPQISICIPTRNRASLLRRCLEHLSTFSSFSFEVVIGDNASTDDTKSVVDSYVGRFASLRYHRHPEDIGWGRNMDAISRMAHGHYIYVISDDDLVFENALMVMKRLLDSNPKAAAVGALYLSVSDLPVGMNPPVESTRTFQLVRGNFVFLRDHIGQCDGHPLMRRESFQRYCAYLDRCLGLVPLYFQLLSVGDIFFIEHPAFLHYNNPDSFSTNISDPWLQDYCAAEVDLAILAARDSLPSGSLELARKVFLGNVYLQSARVCRTRDDMITMWHHLKRAKAIGAVDNTFFLQCERAFLISVTLRRLSQMIRDMGLRRLNVEEGVLMEAIKPKLAAMLPYLEWVPPGESFANGSGLLLETYESAKKADDDNATVIAFHDVVKACRLTSNPINVIVAAGDAAVEFPRDEDRRISMQTSAAYQRLINDYA